MGRDYEVQTEALTSLSKEYKRYGQTIHSRYHSGSSRIHNELASILRKYLDYSSVTSKVYSLQNKLREAEQNVKKSQGRGLRPLILMHVCLLKLKTH